MQTVANMKPPQRKEETVSGRGKICGKGAGGMHINADRAVIFITFLIVVL